MASKLAWSGLLGEVANQGNAYLERERKLEERKIMEAQERRKDEALLLRQKSLAEFNYKLGEGERADAKNERSSARAQHMIEREEDITDRKEARKEAARDRKEARNEAAADRAANRDKPTEYDKKVRAAESDPSLTPEERKAIKYGILKKGELSDYQRIKAEEGLAKLEAGGIDDTNLAAANRLSKQLGLPQYKKSVKTPGKKGWFKDTPPEYEYISGGDEGGETSRVVEPERKEGKPGGLDKYKSILQASGTKDGVVELAEKPAKKSLLESPTPAKQQGAPQSDIISPEERKEMQSMTPEQLQALKLGIVDGDPGAAFTPEGQAIIQEINQLLMQKKTPTRK